MDNFSPQIHRDFLRFLLTPYPLNFYTHATPPGLKASLVLCLISVIHCTGSQVLLISGTSRVFRSENPDESGPALGLSEARLSRFIGDLSGIKSGAGFRGLAADWECLSNSQIYHRIMGLTR